MVHTGQFGQSQQVNDVHTRRWPEPRQRPWSFVRAEQPESGDPPGRCARPPRIPHADLCDQLQKQATQPELMAGSVNGPAPVAAVACIELDIKRQVNGHSGPWSAVHRRHDVTDRDIETYGS